MSIPTGYEKLAVIGIAWKNEYVQGTAYKTMNAVYYNGSTYVALRDNPTGPPAADGANWQYLAKGFEQQLLSAITALDTSGVLGQAGATVGGQALMDAIADKVMTKLIAKSQIVNNLLATEPGNVLDATQGKALKDDITELYSDLVVDRGAVTADFNNYLLPGIYRFNGEPSILNSPGSVAGNLEVIVTTGYVIQRITVYDRTYTRRYNGSVWTDWASHLTNADFENTSITNNYGLAINLFTFGNQNLKAIKITGYINKALTAGTEYTIATNTALKSRVNWYHNIFSGGKGSELLVYISIGTDGNIKITPKTAIASGAAINIAEFYV